MKRTITVHEEHAMHFGSKPLVRTVRRLARLAALFALGGAAELASADTSVTLSLAPSQPVTSPGEALDVVLRLAATTPAGESPAVLLGVQCLLTFDPAVFEPAGPDPIVANPDGPFPSLNGGSSVDPVTGAVSFFILDPSFAGFTGSAADLARLRLRVKPGVTACGGTGSVQFASIGGNTTQLGVLKGGIALLSLRDLSELSFDRTAPVLENVPADFQVASDAGQAGGASVPAPLPAVGSVDGCDPAPSVSVRVSFPDGSSVDEWPPLFPLGSSVALWRARDESGNESTATTVVTVADFQLLDATLRVEGAFEPDGAPFERVVRFSIAGSTVVRTVKFLPFDPTSETLDIPVPVSTLPLCVAAKNTSHSLTAHAGATVSGSRYRVSLDLRQGDSNDDDVVDIIDFSQFVLDFGSVVSSDGRSNFNADGIVNNADFGAIAINFLRSGQPCTAAAGIPARIQISAKDLRRTGHGHLVVADLNRDGWVDARDIEIFLGGGHAAHPTTGDEAGENRR